MSRKYENKLAAQGSLHFLEPVMMDSSTSYAVIGYGETSSADGYDEIPVIDDGYYQYELVLENPHDYIERLQDGIEKFDRAYQRLHTFHHRWNTLMEAVEENDDIAELFGQIQMLRALKGEQVR